MSQWDARILIYWADRLGIQPTDFEKSGFVLRFDAGLEDRLVSEQVAAMQIITLPARYETALATVAPQSLDTVTVHLGLTLTSQGPDFIYYAVTPLHPWHTAHDIRPLTPQDAESLDALQAQCTPDELSLAQVSMDDLRVTGCFMDGQLVGAASLLEKTPDIYDIGVVTHPAYRGRQIGVALTVHLRNALAEEGKIAQYVTMQANRGSVRVAEKSAFDLFLIEEDYLITPA